MLPRKGLAGGKGSRGCRTGDPPPSHNRNPCHEVGPSWEHSFLQASREVTQAPSGPSRDTARRHSRSPAPRLLLPGEEGAAGSGCEAARGSTAHARPGPSPQSRSPSPANPGLGLPELPPAALRPASVPSGRAPASHPSPMEGELLPAAAVAVAALPGRAGLRHLGDGPAAPKKDGGPAASGAEPGAGSAGSGAGSWTRSTPSLRARMDTSTPKQRPWKPGLKTSVDS